MRIEYTTLNALVNLMLINERSLMNATIAIPVENDNIFEHFGKATKFKIYTIENDKVVDNVVAETEGGGHEAVGLWLVMRGVNAVICGRIGPGSLGALAAAGIPALMGIEGNADEAIEKFLAGKLTASDEPNCGGHHGGSCSSGCSSHGCGSGCGGCCH